MLQTYVTFLSFVVDIFEEIEIGEGAYVAVEDRTFYFKRQKNGKALVLKELTTGVKVVIPVPKGTEYTPDECELFETMALFADII